MASFRGRLLLSLTDCYEAKGKFFHVIKRLTLVCWLVGTLKVGNKKADPAADIVLVGLK